MPIKSINHPAADFNNQYWRSGPEAASAAPTFQATGGTKTIVGSYTIHTFTSSGSLVVTDIGGKGGAMDYLIVASGGGGGSGDPGPGNDAEGGGGGAPRANSSISGVTI